MVTRCLTVMYDAPEFGGKEIAVLYRQMDGYPEGHGEELETFLNGFNVVNGLSGNQGKKVANGGNCLAAQIVAHFKADAGAGMFYLHPAGTRDIGEEYIYHVRPSTKTGGVTVKIEVPK